MTIRIDLGDGREPITVSTRYDVDNVSQYAFWREVGRAIGEAVYRYQASPTVGQET
jgi:hypothetical protein